MEEEVRVGDDDELPGRDVPVDGASILICRMLLLLLFGLFVMMC